MIAPPRPLNRPLGLFRDVLHLQKKGIAVPEKLNVYQKIAKAPFKIASVASSPGNS